MITKLFFFQIIHIKILPNSFVKKKLILNLSSLLSKYLIIQLYFLCLYPFNLYSNPILDISSTSINSPVGKFMSYYEDKDNVTSIESILKNENNSIKFRSIEDDIPNFGFSNSSFWVKLDLSKTIQSDKSFYIYIKNSNIDNIILYESKFDKKDPDKIKTTKLGDRYPIKGRFFFNRLYLAFTEINNSDSEILYIKVNSSSSLYLPIYLIDEDSLNREIIETELGFGLYYGFLIAIFIYNLIVFLSTKDITFFYFIIYIFGFGTLQAIEHGHAFLLLWPNSPEWQQLSFVIFLSISISFSSLFAKSFLKTSIYSPQLNKLLLLLSYIGFILIFIVFLYEGRLINIFSIILAIIALFSIFFTSIYIYRKNFEPSKYFLIAWTLFLIGGTVTFFTYLGIYNFPILSSHIMEISSSFKIVLLSYALTAKVNIIKRENQEAIKRTVLFQEQANAELEQKVKERTQELNKYLNSIEKDLKMARNIQVNILPKNLDKCINFQLHAYYNPLEEVGGDFFDFHQMNPFKIRVLIADATGHGIQAAMVTMTIKSEYDSLKTFLSDPGELLDELQKRFIEIYKNMKIYFTAFIVDIDIQAQELTYSSAGHPSQFLLKDGKIIDLPRTGYIIGMLSAKQCITKKLSFSRSDKLLLFTDGLYEEFDEHNQQFGEERLRKIVEENSQKNITDIQELCMTSLTNYLGNNPKQDDITMIGIEVKPFE